MKNAIITFIFILGFGVIAEAQQNSEQFYIQDSRTNRFVVPYYGWVQEPNSILFHPAPASPKEKGYFYFEPKKGSYGLIVSAYDKNLSLCPTALPGWKVYKDTSPSWDLKETGRNIVINNERLSNRGVVSKPKSGTFIGFYNTKSDLCYWKIDQTNDAIIHISGAYMMAPEPGGGPLTNAELTFEDNSRYYSKIRAIKTN